ncbi:hypothetical protein GGS20DRAFT_531047 [Poronia punctata]|nr:hypothetical protein GGS20DRAFT_531047 [Poronia punctata]
MAGRFAAKEAVIKAHPYRRLTFRRIIISSRGGPLVAVVKNDDGVEEEEEVEASVSISHDGEYASAVCLAFNHGNGNKGNKL